MQGEKEVSFLVSGRSDAEKFSVKVNVLAASEPDSSSIKDKIGAIEHKRAGQAVWIADPCESYFSQCFHGHVAVQEKYMFQQAAAEIKGLTDIVVSELQTQLQANIHTCLGRHYFFLVQEAVG
jgi:hypothetical protein